MATQPATFADVSEDRSLYTVTWTLTGTDDGGAIKFAQWADKSIQCGITGDTFNSGTVILEGSNDGTTWTQLHDPSNTAIAFTAAGLKQVLEMTAWVRPRASVSVTSVNVVMAIRRQQPLRL
jgi:hypothetical protein